MFKFTKIVVLALFIVGFAGSVCLADEAQVISSFKVVINKYVQAYKDHPPIMVDKAYDGNGWMKSEASMEANPAFDIQKTDSIIAPYEGILSYKVDSNAARRGAQTEAEAQAESIDYSTPPSVLSMRLTFSYSGGSWVLNKVEYEESGRWWDLTNDTTGLKDELLPKMN